MARQLEHEQLHHDPSPMTGERFAQLKEAMAKRDEEAPKVGDEAPDFELPVLHGDGATVRLSDLRGRPVALIFGSYTWPPFRSQAGRLEELHGQYGEKVAFFMVYIQEAHPTDGWQIPPNEQEGVLYEQPKGAEEREAVAEACVLGMNLSIPTLVDEMTNEVDRAYAALPDRLYLIDAEGRVAYRSGPGPWGFKPEELEAAIRETVGG